MIDLDDTLSRLAAAPAPFGLAAIDDAVMMRLARGNLKIPGRVIGLAAVVSLLVGVAGAGLPSAPVGAPTVTPLGMPSALAPSSLLASRE